MDEAKKLLVTIGVFTGLVLLFLGILGYQVAVYGWGAIAFEDALTIQIDDNKGKLAKLQTRNTVEREKAATELEKLEGMKDMAAQLLPDEVKTTELLNAIANKGKGLVQINDLRPVISRATTAVRSRTTVKQDPFEPVVYDMSLSGSFDEVATFINVMEMFELTDEEGRPKRQFFGVQDIEIEADSDGLTESGRHDVKLKLVTYRFIPPQTGKRGASKP